MGLCLRCLSKRGLSPRPSLVKAILCPCPRAFSAFPSLDTQAVATELPCRPMELCGLVPAGGENPDGRFTPAPRPEKAALLELVKLGCLSPLAFLSPFY